MRTNPIPANLAAVMAMRILATSTPGDGGCILRLTELGRTGYATVATPGSAKDRRKFYAHRVVWTHLRGPIPAGLVIDHLCRVRNCVNVEHMEVVTNSENIRRSDGPSATRARQERCGNGHEFTFDADGRRRCKPCRRVVDAARYLRNKASSATVGGN